MMNEWGVIAPGYTGPRVRVAFFAEILTEGLDGAIRTMYQLIDRIDDSRFEFLFIYGEGPENIKGHQSMSVPHVSLFVNSGYSLALPVLAESRMKHALRKFAPDVVHIATPSLLGNFGLNYARQNGLPVMTIYHTHFISYIDYYFKHLPFLINSTRQLVVARHKLFYNQCDRIYVPSESMKVELAEMGVQAHRMQIWKRGMDAGLFSPQKRNKKALRELTCNDNPTVLFASRLVWEKNLETLFEVYDGMQNQNPVVNFVIAGDGSALKACKTRMPHAVFTGKVGHGQLSVLYASADIFLFPSVSETYGNVVLEAMASGLPCVIADGGGSADFIEQGINGFKCRPYDAADYIEKISLTLANPLLAAQFAQKGLEYSGRLNWDDLAADYFDCLRELALNPLAETELEVAG
ncbi:glycosyltransferase family 4 protein [Mucilaginibacter psychrotolerans]|nr:glycosyltransferase family 1 protein [Mucilaginibacter psychrotolerans]